MIAVLIPLLQGQPSRTEAAPRDPAVWTTRGLALAKSKHTDESLQAFDRALKLQKNYLPALRAASQVAYQARNPRASDYLRRLLKFAPDDTTAHAMAGVIAFESHDCIKAVDHFARAPVLTLQDALAGSMQAQCLLDLRRNSEALNLLRRLAAAHPENMDVRYNLAVALSASGHRPEAIQILTGMREPAAALSLLAVLRSEANDLPGALDALSRALKLAPDDERIYLDAGVIYTQQRNWTKALELLNTGVKRLPQTARLYSMRGVVRVQLGDLEGAAADFDKADRLQAGLGSVPNGVLLNDLKQPAQAITKIREALRSQPQDPLLHFLLADMSVNTGDAGQRKEAEKELKECLRLKPDFARAHALLGKVYKLEGETKRAIAEFEAALRLEPENRQAMQQLILALRSEGRTEDANQVATRFRQQILRRQIDLRKSYSTH